MDMMLLNTIIRQTLNQHPSLNVRINTSLPSLLIHMNINKLNDMDISFDSLLTAEDNNHPLIIKLWMQEEIQLETIVILDSILGFVERENNKITDTIIWPDIYRKIMKYKPFVKFDRNKCLNLLKKTFTNAT
jgi:hypothetical protein